MQAAGHVFPEVFKHGEQHRVSASASAGSRRQVFIVIILPLGEGAVFHQQHLMRMLQEFQPRSRGEDESVILDVLVKEMQDESLVDDSGPETDVVVFTGTEQRKVVMLVGLDHGCGHPGKDGSQVLQLETLRQGLDELDNQTEFLLPVETGLGMQAVVAGAAIVLGIILSEIIEQELAPALAGLCVGNRFIEQLLAYLLLRHRLSLHELLQLLDVLVAVIGDASAFLPVTACAAGFLVVAFYALGNVVMDDETHVRLVYAHAEGDGGHNHVHLFHQEQVLILRPGLGVQAGVVRERLDAVDGQQLGHLLHLLAAETVNDAGLAGILAQEADDVLLRIHFVPHLIIQIGPIEGRLEHLGILDAEILEDVALDLGRGRSREGDDGSQLDFLHDGADFPVFRTEVMAPFRDAVGFVHGVERYLDFP